MTTILALDARDAAEEMALFQTIRNQTARILRAVPGSLDRQAFLVKAGGEEAARTVGQFISGITQHVTHHLAFVHEMRRALGLDYGTPTLALGNLNHGRAVIRVFYSSARPIAGSVNVHVPVSTRPANRRSKPLGSAIDIPRSYQ